MNDLKLQAEATRHAIQTLDLNQEFHEQYFVSKYMTENKLRYEEVELCRVNSWEAGRLVTRFWVRRKS